MSVTPRSLRERSLLRRRHSLPDPGFYRPLLDWPAVSRNPCPILRQGPLRDIQDFAGTDVGEINRWIGGFQLIQVKAEFAANGHRGFAVLNDVCVAVASRNLRMSRNHYHRPGDYGLHRLDRLRRRG